MTQEKKYNFQNPELQARATLLASVAERPKSYKTKKKMTLEIKRELIKEEILKNGFLEKVSPFLDQITEIMIQNAATPEGHKDRKMILTAAGILGKTEMPEAQVKEREYFSLTQDNRLIEI